MEMYGQEWAPGAERPERPASAPPSPGVASGAGDESAPAYIPSDEPMPGDLADALLAKLRNEIDGAELAVSVREHDARNNAALEALARQGVRIGHEVIIMARLATLCTVLLGDTTSVERLRYEARVNEEISNIIAQIESQVSRAKLTTNIVMPPNGAGLPRHGPL